MAGKSRVSPVNGQPLPYGKPFEAGERAREAGRKGGRRSQQKAKERKTLREELLAVLTDMEIPQKDGTKKNVQEAMALSLIKSVLSGNVRAFEIIRDTIGEKPVESVNVNIPDPSVMDEVREYLSEVKG